ncbi:MAG: SH3 domain-containing protein [Christensenellales bacterium]|jgi:hypothetical protein
MKKLLTLMLTATLLLGLIVSPVSADGTVIVGEVTIIASNSVNIRSGGSTDYPIIASARSGALFQTTGQVASGWYEILLPDNVFGYVSNRLVYFYAYPSPIPMGNTQYTLPVYYMTTQGQTLKTVQVPVKVGQNVITADDSQVPGYRLASTRSVYVSVDAMGKAVPNGVIFSYEPLAIESTRPPVTTWYLPVYYKDSFNRVLASEYRQVRQGTQLIYADSSRLPQGYSLTGATDAVVSVGYDGSISPSEVVFMARGSTTPQTSPPTVFSIPVSYRDEQGNALRNLTQVVQPGYTTITANDSLVSAGLQLTSSRNVVVYTTSQGTTFPSTVIFTYKSPQSAGIQVLYRDTSNKVFFSETRLLSEGTHTITANDSNVPGGYMLQGSRNVQVTVYANGTVSQNQVVFTYARPVSASIQVLYRDTNNKVLFSETRLLGEGIQTVSADDSRVPVGYVLQGSRNVQITVYSNGSVSQNQVVFTYAMPVNVSVSVEYRNTDGKTLFSEQRMLPQGTTTIYADDSRVPQGYILNSTRSIQVNVYPDGTVSQDRVIFLYIKPVSVSVQVIYNDTDGKTLNTYTRNYTQGSHTVTADDNRVPKGYILQGNRNITLTVSSNGTANPGRVIFTYTPPAPPVSVNVPVVYKDQDGATLHQTTVSVSSASPKRIDIDKSLAPAGYVVSGATSITVTVSANGTPTPREVVFVFRDPSTITEATHLPDYQTFSLRSGTQAVYSGPGTEYWRAADSRASVSGGRLRVWGTIGDWALIGYGLSNNLYRIGYIERSALPSDLQVQELYLGCQTVTIVKDAPFIDDPIIKPVQIFELKSGTEVTLLAYLSDRAYIETTYENKPIRGFVRIENISKP